MNDFIETRSPEDFIELLMQLRAVSDRLREQVGSLHEENGMLQIQISSLVSSLAGVADAVEERDSLRLEVVELREQLGVKKSVLEQVEVEFSALTHSARLVVEDRDRLREKNEELQASVNRLTNMLWGRRSEKRSDPSHPTRFDLQLTADELAAERQRMVAAEIQLDAASQQQALDDLLARRKRKKLERLGG